jgi:glycerol uptake facilitator-like aquaporin
MKAAQALTYVVAQVAGAVAGTILANVMFDQSAIQISAHSRFTTGTFIGEGSGNCWAGGSDWNIGF